MRKWRSLERKKCWASLGDAATLNSFRKPAQTESAPCPSDFFYFAEFENLPQYNSKKKRTCFSQTSSIIWRSGAAMVTLLQGAQMKAGCAA
jgi:hypothetical protein